MPILYFARGRGRGHALAGLAIAEALTSTEVQFVSYGTGAATLREQGRPVIDLHLPDQPDRLAVGAKFSQALQAGRPSLVVAHEEFDVIAAARLHKLPCVFVTDWFTKETDSIMQLLRYANQVLFLDQPGTFPEPSYLAGKVTYVGPVLRPLRYRRPDRLQARQHAGLPLDALIVSLFIQPGRRTEPVAPLAELLREAFQLLEASPKLLLFDRDAEPEFDRIMAASDLAITKGNRNLGLELAALGVPTISISHGLNAMDDLRTATLASNATVPYSSLNASRLAGLMRQMLAKRIQPQMFADGASLAASHLLSAAV